MDLSATPLHEILAEFERGTGDYYGSAEILFMGRGRQYRRVLGYDSYLLTLPPLVKYEILRTHHGVMTTDALPYNVSPAARLTVGEYLGRDYLDRDRSIEFTYYGGLSYYQQYAWNAVINGSYQTYLVTPLSDATPGFTGGIVGSVNGLQLAWPVG